MADISVKAASPTITVTMDLAEAKALRSALAKETEDRRSGVGLRHDTPLAELYSAVSQAVNNAEKILAGAEFVS